MEYEYLEKYTQTYEDYKKIINKVNEILDELDCKRKDFEKIVDYYYSDQFSKDIDDSNNGKISDEINQGLLTEDTIYDLMGDDYYLGLKFLKLANIILQQK